ncbi:MAG: L,D-transpeptidase [Rhizobiaceae bacterium]
MSRFSPVLFPVLLLSSTVLLAALLPNHAYADRLDGFDDSLYHYELFVDGRGRRFLVDPETGEVIGRANRNARFTRRDKIRAQRALRRMRRNNGWDRDFEPYFDDEIEDQPRQWRQRNANRNFHDNDIDDLHVGSTRRTQQPDQRQQRIQKRQRDQRIARLPEARQPVTRSRTLEGFPKPNLDSKQMVALQVVLDREGFSPGVIDGIWGSNMARALAARKKANPASADITKPSKLQAQIDASGGAVFTTYTITKADFAGPFVAEVPVDYAKKARLAALSYTSVTEMLAERFHMSEAYLRKLNPQQQFNRAGARIKVIAPGKKASKKVHYIVADKGRKQVQAYDRNGKLVASYPATIGSASTPSPSGTHSIDRIALDPEYTYNPKKNFQQGDNDKILRIAPGPNGPVGSVWIALSKPSYGIHGTPNPRTIGKTSSNGCIRLTNWDAQELAGLVRKGVTVEFVE